MPCLPAALGAGAFRRLAAGHSNKLLISRSLSNRAVIFTENGPPISAVRIVSFPPLPPPPPQTLNIRYILSPVNPSDINVIEGVYPAKPLPRSNLAAAGPGSAEQPCFIVGNEGLAEVTAVGKGVKNLKEGDRVIMVKPQAGTWSSGSNVKEQDIIRVPDVRQQKVDDVQGATMTVNPATAYNMLKEFVDLKHGDWIVQNGANGAVGQAVMQIAASLGVRTINFMRDRPDFHITEKHLTGLGATHILPLELLSDKDTRHRVKGLTEGANIRLALNCVSGPTTVALVGLLGNEAHLVSYGAMSKQPLTLPTSAFIFKGLTAHGFMQNKWYKERTREDREALMLALATLMVNGQLKAPFHTIFSVPASLSDEDATNQFRYMLEKVTGKTGMFGKKVLIKFEE